MPRSEADLGAAVLIDVSLDGVQRDVWPSICIRAVPTRCWYSGSCERAHESVAAAWLEHHTERTIGPGLVDRRNHCVEHEAFSTKGELLPEDLEAQVALVHDCAGFSDGIDLW